MAFKAEKTIASTFGNNLNAPLIPEYAFKNAQQSFRFILQVSGLDIAFIQDVKRPSFSIDYAEFEHLGYITKFPKKLKWDSVSFTVIESHDPRILGTVLGNMIQKVQTSGYTYPTSVMADSFKNLSKFSLVGDFGNIFIKTLDPDGQIIDVWKLYNPMISKITPSALKYSDDGLTNIQVEVVYDWAEYSVGEAGFGLGKLAGNYAVQGTKNILGLK